MARRAPGDAGDALEPFIDRVSGPRVMAYLEMHASERERLPDAVRIVITRGETGGALVTVAADVTPDTRGGSWAIARAVVPTAGLAPGRYLARAEVVAGGRTIAHVPRPFTIPERGQ